MFSDMKDNTVICTYSEKKHKNANHFSEFEQGISVDHDDVIKWKHRVTDPFVKGIHRSPVVSPHKKTVTRSFDVFFLSVPEQTVEKTIETPVIWDTIALIMTSI